MRTSHFFTATLGSLFLHVTVAYGLFMVSTLLPKPVIEELVVTHISFLDEPKPAPLPKEVISKPEPIAPPEPIVQKKPEKKVLKEHVKPLPLSKVVQEPVAPTPMKEASVEQTVQASTTAQTHESAKPVAPPKSDDLLMAYLAKVRHKIQESLRYPSMAKKMGVEGETVVQFLIHSNGMVDASSLKIAKSSGKAMLDRNAMDAVLDAIPFEVPPKEAIEIVIPVVFKLKS